MKIPFPKNFNPPKPLKIHDYQDVAIILFASSIKPNQFSLRKFQQEEIIPLDWQLIKPPQKKAGILNFSFLQGLDVNISPRQIIFAKEIVNTTVDLQKIIPQFITKFKTYNYHRSQMVLRRLITLPNKNNSGAKLIQDNLLNRLQWEVLEQQPVSIQANYYYKKTSYSLTINVLNLPIQSNEINSKPCLLFRGIFDYKANLNSGNKQKSYLLSMMENYSENINIFNGIIENNLLNN